MGRALAQIVERSDLIQERRERGVVGHVLERDLAQPRQAIELALVRLLSHRLPDGIGRMGREKGRRDRAPEASGPPSVRRREGNAGGDEEELEPTARKFGGQRVERGADEAVIDAEPHLILGVLRADVAEPRPIVADGEQHEAGERRVRPAGDDDRRELRAIRPVPCVGERTGLKRGRPRA